VKEFIEKSAFLFYTHPSRNKTIQEEYSRGSSEMFTQNGQFFLQILVNDLPLQEYPYQAERFVEVLLGRNFRLRIGKKQLFQRAVAVMSVDGLSIMDGKSAKANGRGYVLELGEQSFDIPGWRLNDEEVAAFVFAAVPDAYASQMGKPTNIGVIGATFFYERAPEQSASLQGFGSPALPPAVPFAQGGSASYGASPQPGLAPSAPGVGTGFGDRLSHRVSTVHFERDQTTMQTVILRYDTRTNLETRGIVLDGQRDRVLKADPFPGDSGCTPPQGWSGW
jgi:hypothetical protein